jgi:hypothetical protein
MQMSSPPATAPFLRPPAGRRRWGTWRRSCAPASPARPSALLSGSRRASSLLAGRPRLSAPLQQWFHLSVACVVLRVHSEPLSGPHLCSAWRCSLMLHWMGQTGRSQQAVCDQRVINTTATKYCNVFLQSAHMRQNHGRTHTADGEAAIVCQAGDGVVSNLLQGTPQRAHPVPLPQRRLDPLQRQEQPSWHEECLGMSLRGMQGLHARAGATTRCLTAGQQLVTACCACIPSAPRQQEHEQEQLHHLYPPDLRQQVGKGQHRKARACWS